MSCHPVAYCKAECALIPWCQMSETHQRKQPKKTPHTIALTGGLCSGKSAVARWLRAQGWPVLDLDQVAREVVRPGQPTLAAIVAAFGTEILHADGSLNRAKLRQIIFNDAHARKRLETITHPAIEAAVRQWLAQQQHRTVFIEIPLLAEKGKPDYVDAVWVVDCDEAQRRQRCIERGLDEETFARICAAQAERKTRLALADVVIDNSGAWSRTQAQLQRLIAPLPRP